MAFWKKKKEDDLLRETPAGPARPIELPKVTESRTEPKPKPKAEPRPEPRSEAGPDPRAEAAAALGAVRSSLGPDTSITGKLSFSAPTRIDGKLKGEIRATDLLIIGEQAVVEGAVRALKLILHGEVQGDVIVSEHTEIVAGGRLRGSLTTPVALVRDGAILDGECRISPKAATAAAPAKDKEAPASAPLAKAGNRN